MLLVGNQIGALHVKQAACYVFLQYRLVVKRGEGSGGSVCLTLVSNKLLSAARVLIAIQGLSWPVSVNQLFPL